VRPPRLEQVVVLPVDDQPGPGQDDDAGIHPGLPRDRERAGAELAVNDCQGMRLAKTLLLVGLAMLIGGLAFAEYRARGTTGVEGITVADYAARAEIQAGPAPDFTLPSLGRGGSISLSSLRGHVTVLNFW